MIEATKKDMQREEKLAACSQDETFDIIIIGGGATGVGSALDAASRGYKTLLLEQYDFGKGTSSKSTKLVHGGVRYMAQGNIRLVKDALRERGILLKNAPHVTKVQPFIIPVFSWWQKIYYGVGLMIYDLLSEKFSIGKTTFLSKAATKQYLPMLNTHKCVGGIMYYDGQFDDAKLLIDLVHTAEQQGATMLNYAKVKQLLFEENKVKGVEFIDTITNNIYQVFAKVVVNATGVFSDAVMQLDNAAHAPIIQPSQGIHLVISSEKFAGLHALMIPKTKDGRVLFAVPWHSKVVLGTTDTSINSIDIEPKPMEEEIAFILDHFNHYATTTISRRDVLSVFVGLRPLIKKIGTKATSLLSRDHTLIVSETNLLTITGGKWTTYRKMAEEVVDNAIFIGKLTKQPCITKTLAIVNTHVNTTDVLSKEKIIYYIQFTNAITVEDVLARRSRYLFLDAKKAIELAPFVATTMAAYLQKNDEWISNEINNFNILAAQYLTNNI